jgi:HlyD family secretion protein
VVKATRPYFFTPAGERVELAPESLELQPQEVDPALVDALGTADAPAAPGAGPAAGAGAPPLPAGARPVYAADGRQVFLSPGAAMRVGSRPAGHPVAPPAAAPAASPVAAPPAAAAAAAPPPAPPVLEPLAAVAAPTLEVPRAADDAVAPSPPGYGGSPGTHPARAEVPAVARADAGPAALPPASAGWDVPATDERGGPGVEEGEPDELGRADAANVEIRSEELDEILSAMPGGLVRWGITAVFMTLVALLGISWYIAYPDVVTGRIALTTPTPPVRLVARAGGEVARVFAADGARVHAGDPLVLLQNPARYADVQALSAVLDRLEAALERGAPLPDPSFGRALALGALQAPYSALQQAYADNRMARDQVFYAQKLSAARQQVADLGAMRERLQSQQALLEQQLALADRSRERTRMLVERGLAAPADVDRVEEEYLQKRVAVENGRTSLTSNEVQLSAQRGSLLDLEQSRSDQGERGLVALRNASHALRAAVAAWEQDNLLRAPVDGTVSYFRELHQNQFASAAEPLVAVLPTAAGLVGRVSLTGQGAGKVRPGQRVIIRFESYPYREYGTVEGRVKRVSQLGFQADSRTPEVTTYRLEITLPRGLVTSYGRKLEFRQEMQGDADVVTRDMRLIERVFNKVRAAGSGG